MGCSQYITIVDQAATTVDNEFSHRWGMLRREMDLADPSINIVCYGILLTIPILKQHHPYKVIYLRIVSVVYLICQGVGSAGRLTRQQVSTAATIGRRIRGRCGGCSCDIVCVLSTADMWTTSSAIGALGFSQKRSLSFRYGITPQDFKHAGTVVDRYAGTCFSIGIEATWNQNMN